MPFPLQLSHVQLVVCLLLSKDLENIIMKVLSYWVGYYSKYCSCTTELPHKCHFLSSHHLTKYKCSFCSGHLDEDYSIGIGTMSYSDFV